MYRSYPTSLCTLGANNRQWTSRPNIAYSGNAMHNVYAESFSWEVEYAAS
jgi:hypothetical protein